VLDPQEGAGVSVACDGRSATIWFRGELDAQSAPRLRQAVSGLIAGGRTDVTLDLKATPFVDSAGTGAIIGAARQLAAVGGVLRLEHPRPPVRRVFELTHLQEALERLCAA
jgi:anti-anti-sigma factor